MLYDGTLPATALPEAAADRRRPGRRDVAPALIPLLRSAARRVDAAAEDEDDDMAPARGMAAGLIISAVFWGIVITAVLLNY